MKITVQLVVSPNQKRLLVIGLSMVLYKDPQADVGCLQYQNVRSYLWLLV